MYRDFIYMDSERVQSIIAQLNEGVLTQIMTGKAKELTGKLSIAASVLSHLLPISAEGSAAYTSNTQSSKVLHDYAFNVALESLNEKGLALTDKDLNNTGVFIPDVAFILIHGTASIVDYNIARNLMDNKPLLEMLSGTNTSTLQNLNRQQRRAGVSEVAVNPTLTIFQQIKEIIDAFMKDSLHVRIKLPNGTTFVGPMTRQFLREDTNSFILIFTPSCNSLSLSNNCSPSTKSIGGAPSLVASNLASRLNVPVVRNKPRSVRPIIAPRKSRIALALTLPR